MKKYINTSNYYLSTITSKIEASWTSGTFDVSDTSVDWVTLPTQWYYWVDVDFGDVSKREIFRIVSRDWYTLTYDARISPYGLKTHSIWAAVWLRDFSQLLNSLSTNTDNFWEVEQTGDLSILVRWGKIFASGNALKLYDVADTAINIPASSERYIVLDYELEEDWIQLAAFTSVEEADLTATGKYPVAKVTSNPNMILTIEDLRSNLIYWGWEWDMKASTYDPNGKHTDAFNMDNMTQWEVQQFTSPEEKSYWDAKQEQLIWVWAWQNIHTINWQNIMWPGNFSLDTILTVWRAYEETEQWASSYQITSEHEPLNENAFMIITDSGTFLVANIDYTYNDSNRTITFAQPLAENEKAFIWVMYNNSQWQTEIGSWVVSIKNWTDVLWTFNVNQEQDSYVDIKPAIDALPKDVMVTEEEYDELPDSKLTDGNRYYIYE